MKTIIKSISALFFFALILSSCEPKQEPKSNCPGINNQDQLKLNIRPTKPIKVPDTMQIKVLHYDFDKVAVDSTSLK